MAVLVWSTTALLARPRKTLTTADRAVTEAWLMVMVLPLGNAVTL